MATNTLLTSTKITKEALMILVEELEFCGKIDRQYDKQFAKKGGKIGNSINIRKPVKYGVRTGATYSAGNITETSTTLTLNKQRGVDFEITSEDLTLSIDDFRTRILKPAVVALASYIDQDALSMYKEVHNQVGTPGTTPATAAVILANGKVLSNEACPKADRNMLIDPSAEASLVNALVSLQNPARDIGKQYTSGQMANALGFDFSMTQNINNHTIGAHGGTPLVDGAQTGAAILTNGWTASAAILKKGDIITFAGVNAVVNPTGAVAKNLGYLRQFTVTADVSADGSGVATIAISPEIITSGVFQTCSASAANDAPIVVAGTASAIVPVNLGFVKEAFTLGMADLAMPKGTDMAGRENYKGLSLRFVRDYDITDDKFKSRLDVLYGFVSQRPELACRLVG